MSNFFLADRVKETSRVQGTGSISLDGAAAGFSAFKDFYASGDVVFYAITDNAQYEIGSGIFKQDGSTQIITRNPFRSSNINVGPWYVNGTSNSGPTNGNTGYFYPLWLSRSAAQSGIGFSTGPFSSASGITFNEYPGITFYHVAQHFASGVGSLANSGANYANSGQPVSFGVGVKEVFVTYPGKTAVYNGAGLDTNTREPKNSGIAFWKNEQILNYTSNLVWNDTNGFLGINKSNPSYSIDVGGLVANSIIRASGFIDGGSGVLFSGGQLTDTLLTASGGRQWEPFRRNRKGSSAEGVIELSGIVDQIIDFVDQPVGTVFAGPISGVCNPCPDDAPSFRRLVASDLPDIGDLQDLWSIVIQKNIGLDNETSNITPNNFVPGMVAIYHSSGNITYDSGIFFDATNNRLLVGGNAATDTPAYTLDLRGAGTLSAATGTVTTINSTSGNIVNLSATSGTINSLLSVSGNMNTLTANSGNVNTLNVVSGNIISLSATSGTIATLLSTSGTIANLFATSGNSVMLVVNSGDINTLSSISGYFNHIVFNNNLVKIGTGAANNSSGIYNVYIGLNAGVAVSGHENIEIVASGSNPSFLTHEASGKINIGNTIVGDIYSARVAIGEPDDASPDATLHIRPISPTEPAFIIQHQNAGSASIPYMQLQSGDSTTFYAVTNSGNVITSGYLNPSGGVLLEPITPSNWMNSTTNRLYNEGGTLKFNGNPITVGGSYSFYLTDGKQASDEITDSQTITVSGVSGVEVAYDPTGGGFFRISASGLSGVLQNQITAQTYKFYSAASGYGSNNNAPKEHLANSYLVVSGVSGVNIDHRNLTDGNNSSGIFIIGYDPAVTYSFNITNGDVASDTIANSQTITISGVSGIRAEYDPANNFIRIGASGLSGVLNSTINNSGNALLGTINSSGNFLRGQILQNTASGLAISGIAAFASGQIVGFTQQSAASGLKIENNTYITNSGDRGLFSELILNSSGSVIINSLLNQLPVSGRHKNGVIIGNYAALSTLDVVSGVIIGYEAGSNSNRIMDSVMIGYEAGSYSNGSSFFEKFFGHKNVFLGYQAGYGSENNIANIDIGERAGYIAEGANYENISIGRLAGSETHASQGAIGIGRYANYRASGNSSSVSIGAYAANDQLRSNFAINIGHQAGMYASGCDRQISIGTQSAYYASGQADTIIIGSYAGHYSSGNGASIFLGSSAGSRASGTFNTICIGNNAGLESYRSSSSTFIGYLAGYKCSGLENSISIKGGLDLYGSEGDFRWVKKPLPVIQYGGYIDIGLAIQGNSSATTNGFTTGGRIHIGRSLDPWAGAGVGITSETINNSALNLTPPLSNTNALMLFLHPQDYYINVSDQTENLFETQYKSTTPSSPPYTSNNAIINQNGVLRLPLATSSTGTGSSAELIDTLGNRIPKGQGVLALYELSSTNKGLAVCLSVNHNGAAPFQWYKLNTTTTF